MAAERTTILLFRPEAQAAAVAVALDARCPGRFRALAAPMTETVFVQATIDLTGVGGLAFTSANGVAALAAQGPLPPLPAWCVGDSTAAAARATGLSARSARGDAAAMARFIAGAWRPGDGAILHVRGREVAGDLAGALAAAGIPAREAVVYAQQVRPLPDAAATLLASGAADMLAFFSPRGARLFAAAARVADWPLGRATAVAISAAADAGLGGLGLGRRCVAATPDREGMVEAIAAASLVPPNRMA